MSNKFLDAIAHVGTDIAHFFTGAVSVAERFEKAVAAAKADSPETIAAVKPFLSEAVTTFGLITSAVAQRGANWITDQSAIAAVEATFKLVPAVLAAVEKEGGDIVSAVENKEPVPVPVTTPVQPVAEVQPSHS